MTNMKFSQIVHNEYKIMLNDDATRIITPYFILFNVCVV